MWFFLCLSVFLRKKTVLGGGGEVYLDYNVLALHDGAEPGLKCLATSSVFNFSSAGLIYNEPSLVC